MAEDFLDIQGGYYLLNVTQENYGHYLSNEDLIKFYSPQLLDIVQSLHLVVKQY